MASVPKTYAEVESFIAMLSAACDDAGMNGTLEKLLSQPNETRRAAVRTLMELFGLRGAPKDLSDAFVCLLDDEVAEKAYEVIYKCRRGGDSAS